MTTPLQVAHLRRGRKVVEVPPRVARFAAARKVGRCRTCECAHTAPNNEVAPLVLVTTFECVKEARRMVAL